MSKKYRLLKDLPDCAIGTEFIFDDRMHYDYVGKNSIPGWYESDTIENNPEWFEEIKEPTPVSIGESEDTFLQYLVKQKEDNVKANDFQTASEWRTVERLYRSYLKSKAIEKPSGNYISLDKVVEEYLSKPTPDVFQWTDELVKEFIIDRNNGKSYAPVYVDDYIKQFKASKTNTPKENIRLKFIPPKQQDKPDWEIVAFWCDATSDKYILHLNGLYASKNRGSNAADLETMLKNPNFKIHSVKRLSDNEVFTVGDEVGWGEVGNYYEILTGFYIKEDKMFFTTNSFKFPYGTSFIGAIRLHKKLPPQPQSKEPDRIEVTDNYIHSDGKTVVVNLSKKCLPNKWPKLKQAIESVLNDDGYFGKIFTPEQVDKIKEDTWNAAREPYCKTAMGHHYKYPTLSDYKNKK